MSANDKQGAANDGMTRKQRRAAERAARKGGGAKSADSASSSGKGSGPSVLLISIGAIAIGLVAVIALVAVSGGLGGDDDEAIEQPAAAAPTEELRQGRTLVAADAVGPVVVEVFEDVQCPHCQTFTERVEPLLIAGPVSEGTASLTYNDYIIFGEDSIDAAVAMRAADELDGAFWDYHHVLYHNAEDGPFTRSWFADIAESLDLDREAFLELLDDEALRAAVQEDQARGAGYGVSSTPSVVVNGELLVAPSWEDLDAAIEAAVEGVATAS